MAKRLGLSLIVLASCIGVSRAAEPSPAERLRHVESSIYWRQRSYERNESRRQEQVADQVATNDVMQWRPYAGGAVFYRQPFSLEAAYGIAPRYPAGGVFEPWPYVPGDIWGYRYFSRARQPIGQRQLQTGPNRWESFPIYEEDVAVAVPAIAPPPAAPPAVLIPRSEPPPRRGPRAF